MLQKIASQVQQAATESHKIAMFHLMVLKHADDLADTDPLQFCRDISVPESYATEFRKMLALRRLMHEQRVGLAFL